MAEDPALTAFIELGATVDQLEKQMDKAEKSVKDKAAEIEQSAKIKLQLDNDDLDAQIAATQARIGGDEGGARLIEIDQRYKREIAMATNAEQKKRLEMLQTLRLQQEVNRQATQPTGGGGGTPNVNTGGISKFTGQAMQAVAVMGTLELGVGAINVLSEAMSGEWEDAVTAIEQLPAGIGPFARQLNVLLGNVTGIRQEIENIEAVTASMDRAMAIRQGLNERQLQIEQDRADILQQIDRAQQLANAAGDEAATAALAQKFADEDSLKAVEKRIEAAKELARFTDQERKNLQDNRDALKEINEQIAKREKSNLASFGDASAGDQGLGGELITDDALAALRKQRDLMQADIRSLVQRQEEAGNAADALDPLIDKQQELIDLQAKARAANTAAQGAKIADETIGGVKVSIDNATLDPFAAQEQEAMRERERLQSEAQAFAKQGMSGQASELMALSDTLFQARLAQIAEQREKEREVEAEAAQKIADARAGALADAETKLKQLTATKAGDDLGAQLAGIEGAYKKQIDAAVKNGEDALADTLRQAQALEEDIAKNEAADKAGKESEANDRKSLGFRDISRDRLSFNVPGQDATKKQQVEDPQLKKTNETLAKIESKIAAGGMVFA
jgi:hypothetical protein